MNNRLVSGRSSETISPHRHEQQDISEPVLHNCYDNRLDFPIRRVHVTKQKGDKRRKIHFTVSLSILFVEI
jgi:hypothetical protein